MKIKSKKMKIFLGIICTVVVILLGIFIYLYFNQPISIYDVKEYPTYISPTLTKELSQLEVKSDVENLIDLLESTHPIFLEDENENYTKAKETFIKETNKKMKVSELQLAVSKYLSSIKDGHTRIRWNETEFLNLNWIYDNNKLLLLDENNMITVKEVAEINGVKIETIISKITELFPAENYAAEAINISNYSKSKMLLNYAGANCSDKVTVTFKDESTDATVDVSFAQRNSNTSNNEISSKKIDDNTFYIKLGVCDLTPTLDSVINELKSAINNGTSNVIIDVSNNPGGNSNACSKILEALKMEPGNYGRTIRFSPLAQEYIGFLRKSGYIKIKGINTSAKNENINLYVITNENTFSSATMLATWVRDGNLGTIVGRASSNMPCSYGDVLPFQLKNSKINGQISFKKWTRPDETKIKERALEPDVKVSYWEDPLEKVLELINN